MTKSRHSATRLRLSKLFRWLAVLCFIKLAVLGMLVLDMPQPGRSGDVAPDMAQQNALETAPNASGDEALQSMTRAPESDAVSEERRSGRDLPQAPSIGAPQGAAAAQLAAAAKPRRQAQAGTEAALPTPLVTAGRGMGGTIFSPPALPAPAPLGAPVAEAGTPAPNESVAPLLAASPVRRTGRDDGLLDVLGLKNLPIPGLGSVQAAHAAALDMPIPQTPASASPFTPAEQNAPMTMPGAPDIPANIPRGQGANGVPLPPRGAGASSAVPSLPQNGQPAMAAPAPRVTATTPPDDPNDKAQELARQQQDILMLRQQMDQRLKDLQDAERKMKDMIRDARDLEDKKVRSLIQMYANMKPRTAAKALESMDERVAIRILSGMAPKQSGEILTYTNPAKTAKFTEMITRMRLPD